jgi:hypothetical protein
VLDGCITDEYPFKELPTLKFVVAVEAVTWGLTVVVAHEVTSDPVKVTLVSDLNQSTKLDVGGPGAAPALNFKNVNGVLNMVYEKFKFAFA